MGRIPVRALVQIPDLELVVVFLMTYLGICLPADPKGKVPSSHNPRSAEPAIPKLIQQLDLFITWSMLSSLSLSIISPLVALVVTSKPPETAPIAQAIPVMALSLFVSLVDSEMDDLNTLQLYNDIWHCFQNCSINNTGSMKIYTKEMNRKYTVFYSQIS